MTIRDRDLVRRRITQLSAMQNQLSRFNFRSLIGSQSVFELLDYGTFQQLSFAAAHLSGIRMETHYDSSDQSQEREIYVPLFGPGDERGRVEFEVERGIGYHKFEIKLTVVDADPGTYAFLLDGNKLGDVVVNSNGIGLLKLSSNPSSGELPFLNGVPDFGLESRIQVGNILEAVIGQTADATDYSIRGGEVEFDLFGAGGARGSVKYELEPEHGILKKEFRVRIRDVAPNQSLDIFVNDIKVGVMNVDDRGRGEVEFSNLPNNDEIPFPPNFPEIVTGTTVRIGDLVNGTFGSTPNLGPNGSGDSSDIAHFQGGLFGPSTSARGGSRYEIELEDAGFLEHKFRVHVRDADPSKTFSIKVDGVQIGFVSTDSSGRGIVDFSNRMHRDRDLSMPSFFPDVKDGTVVQVGDILTATLRDFSSGNSLLAPPDSPARFTRLVNDQPGIGIASAF